MATNENILIRLMADTSNYTAKMQAASASAEKLSTSLEKPRSTSERLEAGFTKTGLAVGALSAAIGVAAVKSFMDFDAKMSEVQANTGTTGSSLNALRDAALNASRTSIYSAEDAADAINELAKAGMSTSDILNGGLSAALTLAASDNMSTADATRYLTSAMTEFGLSGKDATSVADALAAGAGKALGSVSDMGNALSMVGGTAHMMGASMQETVGTLAAMANAGNIGSDAGTELRSALIGLMSPSKQVSDEMKTLGLNLYDGQGKFVGIANFAGQLHDRLSALPEAERNNAMGILFSNAAMSAGNVLYRQGADGINKWTKEVSQSGYAAQIAAEKTDNLKGDLTKFAHTAQDVLIGIGSAANGPLRTVTENATNLLNLFRSMPASAQQWTVGVGLIVGAAAGLHTVLGKLSTSTSSFQQSMGLVLDPVQRLKSGIPQLSEGLGTLTSAFRGPEQGVGLMANGMTRGQTAMNGLKSVGGGLLSMLGGPWGVALTGAAIAVGLLAQKQAEAKARADSYTDALKDGKDAAVQLQSNIASGNNISWSWWDKQQTGAKGFAEALDKAGISAKTFAEAAAGNKSAMAQYNSEMDRLKLGSSDQVTLGQHVSSVFGQQKKAIDDAKVATKAQAAADAEASKQKVASTIATAGLTDATSENTDATDKAASADDILAQAYGASNKGLNEKAEALGEVIDAMKTYYGFALSVFDADTKLGKAVGDANKAISENGRTLDQNTEKGQANRDALSGVVSAIQDQAEAYARDGKGVEAVNKIMEDGHKQVVQLAEAMGDTPQQAEDFANSMGLNKSAVEQLTKSIQKANSTPIKVTDEASKTLDAINLKAKALDDGKKVVISGDNKPFMKILSKVTGAKIDPKTGTLTMDKKQYDLALALANGARINPKTGYLYGENTPYWKKLADANGWRIDPKTGQIYGNDGPFMAVKGQVDAAYINSKSVTINANASGFWNEMARIANYTPPTTSVGVQAVTLSGILNSMGKANGGLVLGPGTGTSDSIPTALSNGEYVMKADAVQALGVGFLDALNYRRYADGGLVSRYAAAPVPVAVNGIPSKTMQPQNTFYMTFTGLPADHADVYADAAASRFRRVLGGRIAL